MNKKPPIIAKKMFNKKIALLSIFLLAINPFNIYYSQMIKEVALVSFFAISYAFYYLFPQEIKILLVRVMFIAAVIFWFYTYIVPGDFGHLDKFEFSNPGILSHSVRLYQFLEMAGILAVSIFLIFLLQRFSKKILVVLVVLNLMAFGQTMSNIFSSGVLKNTVTEKNISEEGFPPDYASELLSFSREQNVLVIMLDMFCGGFIPDILDANPELYKNFEGFTWYANTLSTSDCTY